MTPGSEDPSDAALPPPIPVVAAVIERDGRWLMGLRPADKRHGGLWEFPGGKLDPGESVGDAARRELREELDLAVRAVGPRMLALRDPASPFRIDFHPVTVSGEPSALEHAAVGWFSLDEMSAMPLAPADARFVAWLSRPDSDT